MSVTNYRLRRNPRYDSKYTRSHCISEWKGASWILPVIDDRTDFSPMIYNIRNEITHGRFIIQGNEKDYELILTAIPGNDYPSITIPVE